MASITRLNQHVAALLASTTGFAAGVTLGWNSLAGYELRTTLGWDQIDAEFIVSIIAAGAVLGALILGLLPQKCQADTSKALFWTALPPLILGWTIVCYGEYSYYHLLWGRILCGFGLGSLCTLVPLYIGEITAIAKHQRDTLLFYFHMMVSCGIACSFAVASNVLLDYEDGMPLKRYSMGCAAACIPALLCCALPRSPLQRIQREESDTINVVQDEINNLSTEYEQIRSLTGAIKKSKMKMLGTTKFWGRFLSVVVVTALQQLSGASPIIFNALTLFDFAGSGKLTFGQLHYVCGLVLIVASILSVLLVTYLGRKKILMISSFFMGTFLILLGWYIKSREIDPEESVMYNWMPPTCIILYFACYSLGVGPVSWALLADSFPMQLRILAASITSSAGWLICLILNHQLRALLETLGIPGTFWLFSCFCLLTVPLACCLIRETGSKSLTDVHSYFRIS